MKYEVIFGELPDTETFNHIQEYIEGIENVEGIFVTENELTLSTITGGYLRIKNTMEPEILEITLDNFKIHWEIIQGDYFVRTFVGEIREYIFNNLNLDNYKKLTLKEIQKLLRGDINDEKKGISIGVGNKNKSFIIGMINTNTGDIMEIEELEDLKDFFNYDEYIQQHYKLGSYIKGVCSVKNKPYEVYENLRNNILIRIIGYDNI